jgi:hypothetical protein
MLVVVLGVVACSSSESNRTDSSGGGNAGSGGGESGAGGTAGSSGAAPAITFQRIVLHTEFYNEDMAAGDFDLDGNMDVVAGPFWYEGPEFATRHELYAPALADVLYYSEHFFNFVYDVDGDTDPDVVEVGFPGQNLIWRENPGDTDGAWPAHVVFSGVDAESPVFTDLTGDGRPELLCAHGGQLGWIAPDWSDPSSPWTFHPLSPVAEIYGAFTHGLGAGDVTGDGRLDVLERTGSWQQPEALDGDPTWLRREQFFGDGGAQMHAYDVDGDSDNDVVTTWGAHAWGLSWFEQTAAGFVEHPIAPKSPDDTLAGPLIHEPHALNVADIDGDGLLDLVTGHRFWGHVPEVRNFDDPGELYWFRLERSGGMARFVPHVIDLASGVGVAVGVADVNADEYPDVLVANKKGAFVFLQQRH